MEFFSPGHLLVLAIVVAILFFGWKQLPDMSRSLGRSLRIFKTEIKGMTEDDKAREAVRESETVQPQAAQPRALGAAPDLRKVDAASARPTPVQRPAARPRPTPHRGDATVDTAQNHAAQKPVAR